MRELDKDMKETDPMDLFIKEMREKVNQLEKDEEVKPTQPVIQSHDFTFDRTPLSTKQLSDRRFYYTEYRKEPIQYELVNKYKTNKTEKKAGLVLLKTAYFHNDPKGHANVNFLVNVYHSPFHSLEDLYVIWRREYSLINLLEAIDEKEKLFTHLAKRSGVPDSLINQEREKLDEMENEVKKKLVQLTKDTFDHSYEYLHYFTQEVILPLYSVEQEYDVFLVRPRDKNYYKSVYFNQVINRYHYFFRYNESILLEDEDKSAALLICLKSKDNQIPYQSKEYLDMLNFQTYFNYINI